MFFLKNKKAITLISLVVTIVILVILAAIAINMAIGNNGLFNKAKLAKQDYSNAADKEKEDGKILTNDIDDIAGEKTIIENTRGQIMVDKDEYDKLLEDVEKLSTIQTIPFSIQSNMIKGTKNYCKKTGHLVSIEINGDTGSQNITPNQLIVLATGLPKCVNSIQELTITMDSISNYQRAWIDSSGKLYMWTSASGYTGNIFIGGTYITSE